VFFFFLSCLLFDLSFNCTVAEFDIELSGTAQAVAVCWGCLTPTQLHSA